MVSFEARGIPHQISSLMQMDFQIIESFGEQLEYNGTYFRLAFKVDCEGSSSRLGKEKGRDYLCEEWCNSLQSTVCKYSNWTPFHTFRLWLSIKFSRLQWKISSLEIGLAQWMCWIWFLCWFEYSKKRKTLPSMKISQPFCNMTNSLQLTQFPIALVRWLNSCNASDKSNRNNFVKLSEDSKLTDLLDVMRERRNPLHRVAVVDNVGKLSNLISQSDVVRFLQKNKSKLGTEVLKKKMSQWKLIQHSPPVVSASVYDVALNCFVKMHEMVCF